MSYLDDLFGLDGRVALVTGASRGIGNAIALGFAKAGATVIASARSPRPDLPLPSVDYLPIDLSEPDGATTIVRDVVDAHGRLDILVNAAGVSLPPDPDRTEDERFVRTVEFNLTAIYRLCITAIAAMPSEGGSVINVTSIAATVALPGNPGYIASKGGLRMLTRALANDHGQRGVRVNNLAPGYVRTAMTADSYGDPRRQEQRRRQTMLGRWGEVEDMVGAAIFLASPASRYVTGQDLLVDGGWTSKGMIEL